MPSPSLSPEVGAALLALTNSGLNLWTVMLIRSLRPFQSSGEPAPSSCESSTPVEPVTVTQIVGSVDGGGRGGPAGSDTARTE